MKQLRYSTTDSDMDSKAKGNKGVVPIEVMLNKTPVQSDSGEEVNAFISLMHRILRLNPVERPTAA